MAVNAVPASFQVCALYFQVQNRFGDRFAFFSLASICCLNKHLQRWKELWTALNEVSNQFENLKFRQYKNLMVICSSLTHSLSFYLSMYVEIECLRKE
jgi:hypothetical protein